MIDPNFNRTDAQDTLPPRGMQAVPRGGAAKVLMIAAGVLVGLLIVWAFFAGGDGDVAPATAPAPAIEGTAPPPADATGTALPPADATGTAPAGQAAPAD